MTTLTNRAAASMGLTLVDEFHMMRARFHRALAVSVGVHALLALTLTLLQGVRPDVPRLVEVTWLEPAVATVSEPVAAVAPPPAPKEQVVAAARPRVEAGAAAEARREAQLAELAATRDAVRRQLDASPGLDTSRELGTSLELGLAPASSATRQLLAAAPPGGSDLTRLAAGSMMPVAERGRPAALARGPEVKGPALALNRGPARVGGGLPQAATMPVGGAGSGGGTASAQAATAGREAGTAPGDILLEGPASDRPVVDSTLPQYPDWARRQAVEAAVTLHFTVLPDGRVREDVQVLRTGGFRDFDERAVAALRQWRFAALAGGDAGGQWGTITFRFRLRG